MDILLTLRLSLCQTQVAREGDRFAGVPVEVVVEFEMIVLPVGTKERTAVVP